MKRYFTYFLVVFVILSALPSFSQNNAMNRLSFDIAGGYNQAIHPYRKDLHSNFNQLQHVELGARYMFTEKIGIRLNYANDRFKNFADGVYGVNFSRVGVDAVYNLGRTVGLDVASRSTLGLLTHVGVGYTRLKPIRQEKSEQIGALVLGITPQVKLTERIAFFLDLSYDANFKQHYSYDGALISEDYKPTVGTHYTAALGFSFYLGEEKYHADWY